MIKTQSCSQCTAELPVTEMTHDEENDLYFCAAPDDDRPFCADLIENI